MINVVGQTGKLKIKCVSGESFIITSPQDAKPNV